MTDEYDKYLTPENIRRVELLHNQTFFLMPRGNPGEGLTKKLWRQCEKRLRKLRNQVHRHEVSFETAVREAFQIHLELEVYRNQYGTVEPTERRSVLLTRTPVPLSEPESSFDALDT